MAVNVDDSLEQPRTSPKADPLLSDRVADATGLKLGFECVFSRRVSRVAECSSDEFAVPRACAANLF